MDWHRKSNGIPEPKPEAKPAPDVAARLKAAFTHLAARK